VNAACARRCSEHADGRSPPLFAAATIDSRRVTLAPLNTLPLLRTHRLAWITELDA
jgi:hypothetical protein